VDKSTIALVISAFTAALALAVMLLSVFRNQRGDWTLIIERLVKIETKDEYTVRDITKLQDDILKLTALLLHKPEPKHARRDYLIERLTKENINISEFAEFVGILERTIQNGDDRERLIAEFTLEQLRRKHKLNS